MKYSKIELLSLLQLQNTKGLGHRQVKKLLDRFHSAEGVIQWARDGKSKKPQWVNALLSEENQSQVQHEYERIQEKGWRVLGYGQTGYPRLLGQIADPPLLLFTEGGANLNADRILSIVGTRRMTGYGAGLCKELIQELVPYRPTIVSGFAEGIDITAQMEAVRLGLPTVACLAHGLMHLYPAVHRHLKKAVLEQGCMLTEFWGEQSAQRFQFVQRNRIIAGLSEATLVLQSAKKGGSLLTAELAHDYNRDVFAAPGRMNDPQSRGCLDLIRDHKAQLICEPQDVAEFLNWTRPTDELSSQKGPISESQTARWAKWPKTEQSILKTLLKNEKMTQDSLMNSVRAKNGPFLEALLKLELAQEIRLLPGQMWALV